MFLCALKLGFDTQESKGTQVPTEGNFSRWHLACFFGFQPLRLSYKVVKRRSVFSLCTIPHSCGIKACHLNHPSFYVNQCVTHSKKIA